MDGERLLTLTRAGDPTLSALAEREALKPHFLALLEIFDAVHDCAVLEGTHAATQGQSAHASAVFEAVNQGTRLPPEFSANRIPKSGTSVSHRVALVLPKAQWPLKPKAGWGSGLRDKIWPEVELWLRDLLPSAAEIGLTFAGKPMALADLQMSAIDAVFLMGDDPTTLSPAMRMLIAGSLKADPDTGGEGVEGKPGSVPLEEVQIIAAELRGLLSAASEMTSATFGPAGSSPTLPAADPQVEQRIVLALTDLETAIQQRDPIALARFGIASGDVKQRFERAERMLASAQDASGRAQGERTQALFGKGMPPCRSFAMPKGGGIAFHERLKDHDAWGWLDKVAAVRPVLRHLGTARMLSGMLTPLGLSARIGQDRLDVNEAWCAVSGPPQGTGGRLSLVAIGGKAMPEPGDPVTGFMLDQWSERIAAQDQLTGVALHYDAPSSKPPQAMLLAAAPNGAKHWRMRDVAQTLFDTLQFAALRMVQPEDLTDFGGVLPTTTAELSDSLLEQEMGK